MNFIIQKWEPNHWKDLYILKDSSKKEAIDFFKLLHYRFNRRLVDSKNEEIIKTKHGQVKS